MKVIICGAGEVGNQICRDLSEEDCELTVIDRDAHLLRSLTSRLSVSGITGEAGDPDVLKSADVVGADLIIAATPSDHANIVICLVAQRLGSQAWKMARLKNNHYLEILGRQPTRNGYIDEAINPDKELAQYTVQLLESPSLFDRRKILADDNSKDEMAFLCGLRLDQSCSLLNTPLRQLTELFSDLNAVVVGFRRHSRLGIALANDQLFEGDEIYLCTSKDDLSRTVELFGKTINPCRRVVMAGAGRVGMEVARHLDTEKSNFSLKMIEIDRARAEAAADSMIKTVILHANAMSAEVLEEAGIHSSDAIVAVTHDDRTNLLVASQAKKLEDGLVAVSLVNDRFLMPLAGQLDIDAVIDPRGTIMSNILSRCRGRQIRKVGFIGNREAELIEATITEKAQFVGRKIRNAGLPERVLVGALKKKGKIVKVTPETRLEVSDEVAFFALKKDVIDLLQQLDSNASTH